MKSQQEQLLKAKKIKLEKELHKKTLELGHKNRELKIEAALEKVRSVAMKMKQPKDMIDICRIISKQLQLLKIENIRNVQTAIINDEKGTYLNYEYFTQYKTTSVLEIETKLHPRVQKFVNTIKKSADAFFTTGFKGRELQKWSQYRKQTGQNPDPILDKAKSLHYYFYSIGPGALGISTYVPLAKEEIKIFHRFRNVFDLAYKRFTDIEKAIAQAREAQIEASLEKVRASAMSMIKSEDLLNVCETLYKEFQHFGFPELRNAMINIHNDAEKTFVNYDYSDEMGRSINPLTYNIHPVIEKQIKHIRSANDAFSETVFEGDDLKSWKKFRRRIGEKDDPRIKNSKALYYYFYSIGEGSIGISTFSEIGDDKLQLLKRFRNVFSLAYQRYADIAKAEAQAKEAKIEASLERMRAVAMSMRKSEELIAVCESMYRELINLGFANIRNAQIVIKDQGKETYFVNTWSDDTTLSIHEHPLDTSPIIQEIYQELEKSKDSFYQKELSGKEFKDWRSWRMGIDSSSKDDRLMYVDSVCFYLYSIEMGHMGISTFNTITKEQLEILKRFKNVFELSYRRYTDVAQAEAQFRESQIELALERVRARTMAMQHSDELKDAAALLFQQAKALGVPAYSCGYNIWEKNEKHFTSWMSTQDGSDFNAVLNIPLTEDSNFIRFAESRQKGEQFFVLELRGERMKEHYQYLKTIPEFKAWFDYAARMGFALPETQIHYIANFSHGNLLFITLEPCPEFHDVFKRFATVFDQTYTRFLDLQKAEAQAREAQIEVSLERVRAKAMAMHNSSDLSEAAGTVFTEFNKLGINPIRTGFVLLTKDSRKAKLYPATSFDKENTVSFTGEFEFTGHPVFEKQYESWQKKENYFPVLEDEVLKSYYKILSEGLSVPYQNFPTDKKQFGSFLPFTEGFLFTWSDEPYTEKEINILERFKAILDLTIRRYIDLKTAEAQAREAKIEAALERVRAKAMAMHSSKDLAEALSVFYRELKSLSVTPRRCGVALMDKETKMTELTTMNTTEQGDSIEVIGHIKMAGHPVLDDVFENWLVQKEYHAVLRGNQIKEYYQVLKPQISYPDYSHDVVQYGYYFMFNEGDVYSWTDKELTDDDLKIYRRFTSVISLTYKRYKDLQQAEAQAREAKIEAALERVRAKAMAMHKTDDLNDAVTIVFDELEKLNLGMIRCGIGILSKEKRCAEVWTTTVAEQGRITQVSGDESMDIHPLLMGAFDAWLQQGDFSYVLEGDDMSDYYRAVRETNFHLPESQIMVEHAVELKHYYYGTAFESGMLFAFCETDFSDEAKSVMKRFAGVFNLTYKRFLDIQNAEAQAREALIEVALERVRSRTLAMQRSDELAETAAVLFKQLITLGIEPNRLYIGIIKDDSGDIEAWATDEYGGKVSTMFTLNAKSNASVKKMFDGWKEQNKSITVDMQGQELKDYFHYLGEDLKVPFKPGPSQKRRVQNIAYFSKGFIGLASPDSQPEATTNLLERFAGVFNLTYTRFNDLQIAEQHAEQAKLDLIKLQFEKKRAENALTELRTTQAQLIQSEKMASLGELTAGIAHEIKNPLNFVNNFSDLSTDLVDEFVNTKDEAERKELAEDLKKNLIIISEHGRRADSIVKNMLEHSRTGSGKKQLTDINQLCIEFFNLAYHGNRANIPDFNCEMKKELAPDLPQINVVSQDISRVLLNLFNNAFYAVNEKSLKSKVHGSEKNYKPTVELITKLSNQQIVIMVRDNGNGIPDHIKEKIFEPFFTTKPAGKGTGLGLSLSYDIITKGHSGELKVESKENEFTEFIIVLPV